MPQEHKQNVAEMKMKMELSTHNFLPKYTLRYMCVYVCVCEFVELVDICVCISLAACCTRKILATHAPHAADSD